MLKTDEFFVDGTQTTTGSEHVDEQAGVSFEISREHRKRWGDAGCTTKDIAEIIKVETLSTSEIKYIANTIVVVVDELIWGRQLWRLQY